MQNKMIEYWKLKRRKERFEENALLVLIGTIALWLLIKLLELKAG